jgi:hypothetical protein
MHFSGSFEANLSPKCTKKGAVLVSLVVLFMLAISPHVSPSSIAMVVDEEIALNPNAQMLSGSGLPEARPGQPGQVYYVAPDGHDEDPGTEARPFRTIGRAATVLGPGDKLYIRAGTYHEKFTVPGSGTPDRPIVISAYPGEQPVIDGEDTLPGAYDGYLVTLKGDHVVLSGLEIKNVYGSAVWVQGSHNTVRNMTIHHCLSKGILVGGVGYCPEGVTNVGNTIENNEIWMTSLVHEGIDSGGRWTAGINVARCPQDTLVRGNTVHETWGLGIQVYETYSPTVEANVVWNNQKSQVYVNNAPYATVRQNLIYNSADTTFLASGRPGVGIGFCDEKSEPVSHHVTIINNLVLRGNRGFYFFNQQPGSGLKEFLIAHNTFAHSHVVGLQISDGVHENTRIWNNLFLEGSHLAIVPQDPDLDFSHNLWEEPPPSAASSVDDVIGSPRLRQTGSTGRGELDPAWFRLSPDSPAIDAGVSLADVQTDFYGVARPQGTGYDIGAYESSFSKGVTDLQVVDTTGGVPTITFVLRWTSPPETERYALRGSNEYLTEDNWADAQPIASGSTMPGPEGSQWLTVSLPYTGGIRYFALRFENGSGALSELSNNASWPLPRPRPSLQMPERIFRVLQGSRAAHGLRRFIQNVNRYSPMNNRVIYVVIAVVIGVGVILLALVGGRVWDRIRVRLRWPLPVSDGPIATGDDYTDLIFLHHSVGRSLIKQGNVRKLLTQKGYRFWDHDYNFLGLTRPDGTRTRTSYGIPAGGGGGDTDPDGLAVLFAQPVHNPPDNAFSRLMQHDVLMFKSCFTSSSIASDEELELQKNAYLEIRDVIDRHPDKVFIFLTAPPLHPQATTPEEATRARALANWLTSDAFLAGRSNMFVFDFFDLLADPTTNVLRADYQRDTGDTDSHPNATANRTIGPLLARFVDEAVQTYHSNR